MHDLDSETLVRIRDKNQCKNFVVKTCASMRNEKVKKTRPGTSFLDVYTNQKVWRYGWKICDKEWIQFLSSIRANLAHLADLVRVSVAGKDYINKVFALKHGPGSWDRQNDPNSDSEIDTMSQNILSIQRWSWNHGSGKYFVGYQDSKQNGAKQKKLFPLIHPRTSDGKMMINDHWI